MIEVTVDDSAVRRGMTKLIAGLGTSCQVVALEQAKRTSDKIEAATPVLTGALAATVNPEAIISGGQVHYGGTLPYARKIERSRHPVANNIKGANREFKLALEAAAAAVIRSL